MPFFSAFSTFGLLRFSSEPPQAQKFYDILRHAFGPGFQGPVADARTYAHAMALGIAQCEQDRAAGQFRPDRLTEMLAGKEAEYGIVPSPTANRKTRRAAVAAAEVLRNGARLDAMIDGLSGILGSAFVTYLVNNAETSPQTPIPANPLTVGTYKPPSTTVTVVKLATVVMPSASPQTVEYTYYCGENSPLKSGDTLEIEPGMNGTCEPVLCTASSVNVPSSSTMIYWGPSVAVPVIEAQVLGLASSLSSVSFDIITTITCIAQYLCVAVPVSLGGPPNVRFVSGGGAIAMTWTQFTVGGALYNVGNSFSTMTVTAQEVEFY